MLKFFACLIVAHFIGAAHVEIGRWLRDISFSYDLPFLLPLSNFLRPTHESVQLTVVFTLWFFILAVFAIHNSFIQRAAAKSELIERQRQEALDAIKDVKI